MSGYSTGEPPRLIPIAGGMTEGEALSGGATVYHQLEGLVRTLKQLEEAVTKERAKNQRLETDFRTSQYAYDGRMRELESKVRELLIQEAKLKGALGDGEIREKKQTEQYGQLKEAARKIFAELKQYKTAWASVLQREREARAIITESIENRKRRDELEIKNKELLSMTEASRAQATQADRHAKGYQKELQSALVRIHSSEAHFSQLQKELQALRESKKGADEEVARIEASMRERLRWELAKERERIKAEVERESALDREKFREALRNQLKEEFSRDLEFERDRFSKTCTELEADLVRLQEELMLARRRQDQTQSDKIKRERELEERLETTRRDLELALEDRESAQAHRIEDLERRLDQGQALGAELQAQLTRVKADLAAEQEQSRSLAEALAREKAGYSQKMTTEVERLRIEVRASAAVVLAQDLLMRKVRQVEDLEERMALVGDSESEQSEIARRLGDVIEDRDLLAFALEAGEREIAELIRTGGQASLAPDNAITAHAP